MATSTRYSGTEFSKQARRESAGPQPPPQAPAPTPIDLPHANSAERQHATDTAHTSDIAYVDKKNGAASKTESALITTPRLSIRKLTPDDATALFACVGNPNVARLTTWDAHRSHEETKDFIQRAIDNYDLQQQMDPLGVALKDASQLIVGFAGYTLVSNTSKTAEISYALREDLWGKGLIGEACAALIDHVFQNHDINRIQAKSLPGNVGSARVLSKLGLKFEGRLRESMLVKGKLQDIDIWSILRSEYDRIRSDSRQKAVN